MARTLFDKIWDNHVIADLGDGWALIHIDRHLLHDMSGARALNAVSAEGLTVHSPRLNFATADHAISSSPGRTGASFGPGEKLLAELRLRTAETGIRFFDLGEPGQGIVHVMGPELGITQPGATLICGDSHTCTNGGLGALAFGVGFSELTHALATQALKQQKPKRMRINFEGELGRGVTPKDVILHVIGKLGAASGTGYAIEHAGPTIRAMSIEGRMTICNLTVEMGAKIAQVAPDETTFAYLEGRRFTPKGRLFEQAVAHWRTLASDEAAVFDREETFRAADISPTITWGVSPEHAIGIEQTIPSLDDAPDPAARESWRAALDYMGLESGRPIAGTKIDWVFIGSCANSRLSDLRDAAKVARGKRVAEGVTAWVVPGSEQVKRAAVAEGLDRVFTEAGFQWREPGCSMCVAANGERVPPGARAVSTTNRNFVGRQGPGARTHLASPAMAAAAAVAGAITDVRRL